MSEPYDCRITIDRKVTKEEMKEREKEYRKKFPDLAQDDLELVVVMIMTDEVYKKDASHYAQQLLEYIALEKGPNGAIYRGWEESDGSQEWKEAYLKLKAEKFPEVRQPTKKDIQDYQNFSEIRNDIGKRLRSYTSHTVNRICDSMRGSITIDRTEVMQRVDREDMRAIDLNNKIDHCKDEQYMIALRLIEKNSKSGQKL